MHWKSQFANDPRKGFSLYLELLHGEEPVGEIRRGGDGQLYLTLFSCPDVAIPFDWLVALTERAKSLPLDEEGSR